MHSQLIDNSLELWIKEQLARSGPVTFAQFMAWALYHPELGYYSAGPNIGSRGDFVTSPEASPAFGQLLARHVTEIDALLGSPPQFALLEFGPGKGTLADEILTSLKLEVPELYNRLNYWLVETSPGLTRTQTERLTPEHEARARWATDVRELPGELAGAVIANEFIDALPVHILENRNGAVLEQYVTTREDNLTIIYLEPSDARLLDYLRRNSLTLNEGQKAEINLLQAEWLDALTRKLKVGVVTIIDYGDTAPRRYSDTMLEGTLLAYYGGAVTDKVLLRPGQQDITALVDFTALQTDAQSAGFDVLGLTRQATFLVGLGLGSEVSMAGAEADLQANLNRRRGTQALISMEGLGRFHVLLLGKAVPVARAAELRGLRYSALL